MCEGEETLAADAEQLRVAQTQPAHLNAVSTGLLHWTLHRYFQADVEFALTFVSHQCASGCLHSDHSGTHAMGSAADVGGVTNPLVNGNCSFISTAMQPLDTFQIDTSDSAHRAPGVRRLDEPHAGRSHWMEARLGQSFDTQLNLE